MEGELDWFEMLSAAMVGVVRQIRHRANGDKHKYDAAIEGGWERDIESACAEKFTAKTLRLYWFDGKDGSTDVGPYQVRHTSHQDGRLVLHEDDKDDEVFILVVGRTPKFRLVGWARGREGKKTEYWSDPTQTGRFAFFASRAILHSMEELPPEGPVT